MGEAWIQLHSDLPTKNHSETRRMLIVHFHFGGTWERPDFRYLIICTSLSSNKSELALLLRLHSRCSGANARESIREGDERSEDRAGWGDGPPGWTKATYNTLHRQCVEPSDPTRAFHVYAARKKHGTFVPIAWRTAESGQLLRVANILFQVRSLQHFHQLCCRQLMRMHMSVGVWRRRW